jgi:hypothetical protein
MESSGCAGVARRQLAMCVAVVGVALAAEAVSAEMILQPGRYRLNNHPNGDAEPPKYGLRLDDLIDVNPGQKDRFTFDFDAPGAQVWLNLGADSSITISGMAFGGLDQGDTYDPAYSGWWEFEFIYDASQKEPDGDDDIVVPASAEQSSGWISQLFGDMTTWDLFDYPGSHLYTFRLGNEDNDEGHRGFDGISGWGWLNYGDPDTHVSASDWLFTLEIPAPGALPLLAALTLLARRRRRA